MKRAYMDHVAATPVRPEVLAAMLPYFAERFGNPSAVYDLGSGIKAVMEEQRDKVARLIGARTSPVLGAVGIKPEVAQGFLVFTLNRANREEDVYYVLSHLPPAVENLRSFSPVWRQKMAEAAGAPR